MNFFWKVMCVSVLFEERVLLMIYLRIIFWRWNINIKNYDYEFCWFRVMGYSVNDIFVVFGSGDLDG